MGFGISVPSHGFRAGSHSAEDHLGVGGICGKISLVQVAFLGHLNPYRNDVSFVVEEVSSEPSVVAAPISIGLQIYCVAGSRSSSGLLNGLCSGVSSGGVSCSGGLLRNINEFVLSVFLFIEDLVVSTVNSNHIIGLLFSDIPRRSTCTALEISHQEVVANGSCTVGEARPDAIFVVVPSPDTPCAGQAGSNNVNMNHFGSRGLLSRGGAGSGGAGLSGS